MTSERVYFKISGDVQGIGFRWFAQDTARDLFLTGWVRNIIDGSVEGEAQGNPDKVALFLRDLKVKHGLAYVSNIETDKRQTLKEEEFIIRPTV
ncbi:MAG: acylphosphatase [Elusimicrobiota bacterium]|nr:acylphosphatase [Elusimicrobiota bacterium]